MKAKYIALIPAYEPDELLFQLLDRLSDAGFGIVVVDDGSGPDYKYIFDEAAARADILTHQINQGKGQALKTGLAYIRDHYGSDSVIVTVDADGQHTPEDAMMLCEIAEEHPDTLVLGSRKLKDNVPLRSRFGNTATRMIYRLTTGLKVHDTQTGLRAFSMDLVPDMLRIQGDRYEYEMNVLLECARDRVPILEKEIETIYLDNNAASHFDTIRDSYRVYREILRFSAASFAGFTVDYVMYSALLLLTGNLLASNIGARAVSATVNYTLNRKFVFRSKNGILQSAASYFALAGIILVGNTTVLNFLVNDRGIGRMSAKLMTEILFFMFSWLMQRLFVFRNRNSNEMVFKKDKIGLAKAAGNM